MANLAALLEKEAGAEIEAMLSEARTRASEIVANAKSEAESILAQRERSAKTQHEATLVRARVRPSSRLPHSNSMPNIGRLRA